MRLFLASSLIAFGMGCVSPNKGPFKTEVVTFPDGAVVEFNGRTIGRAPAAVYLPQDVNGRLTERAVLRALPNTGQTTLYAQSRVLDPSERQERVPNQVMIDLTLRDTQSPGITITNTGTTQVETSTRSSKIRVPRSADRGKPTRPVGLDRWNPGIY